MEVALALQKTKTKKQKRIKSICSYLAGEAFPSTVMPLVRGRPLNFARGGRIREPPGSVVLEKNNNRVHTLLGKNILAFTVTKEPKTAAPCCNYY